MKTKYYGVNVGVENAGPENARPENAGPENKGPRRIWKMNDHDMSEKGL